MRNFRKHSCFSSNLFHSNRFKDAIMFEDKPIGFEVSIYLCVFLHMKYSFRFLSVSLLIVLFFYKVGVAPLCAGQPSLPITHQNSLFFQYLPFEADEVLLPSSTAMPLPNHSLSFQTNSPYWKFKNVFQGVRSYTYREAFHLFREYLRHSLILLPGLEPVNLIFPFHTYW